ncbi:hypothetical protein GJ744_011258 [Endocarpon pusillum]|uniref:UBL3-like ubiquitin domain-containing protein n=1 Tax=Endocarpon pusillum TaxID=364733 RepID=A0A8H7AU46_9EURO|nr:hypothetical protein GJ744_011258 [Endocarpon pusillum]
MASIDQTEHATPTSPHNVPRSAPPQSGLHTSSTPVEMSSLSSNNNLREAQSTAERQTAESLEPGRVRSDPVDTSRTEQNTQVSGSALPSSPTTSAAPIQLARLKSTAIGPSSDEPIPVPKDVEETGPVLMITLLLINVQGNDPFNLSVYKLKELILREWREEWEAKPSSPSSIRLISFGKLLDDKAPLRDSKFNHDTPNVVHMTVKPQDMLDEEEAAAKGGKSGSRHGDGDERSPGCRCVIL